MEIKPSVSCKVDWISATNKKGLKSYGVQSINMESSRLIAEDCFLQLGYASVEIFPVRPLPHYVFAWCNREDNAVVFVPVDLELQGVLYRCSGAGLQDGFTAQVRLSQAVANGWRVTRLDVAYDFVNFGESVYGFSLAHREYNEKHKRVTTGIIEGKSGCTYTIGSRSSLVFCRLYDKGGEQRTDLDWKRLEFEIKDEKAVQFADLGKSHITMVTGELLRWTGEFEHKFIDALSMLALGDVTTRITTHKPIPARAKWFLDTVLSAYRKWALDDPVGSLLWIDDVEKEHRKAIEELETKGLTPLI